ncbi:hypothetical protein RBI89_19455 [Bacillus subtilis]|uniref:hypothetical protein n=1 Tax=Bacillus subtilis TaxID=1423 RepID=UPI0027E005FF|nr:hypothetical protein [Bacillus subtilis]MDQ4711640.1 hypothetical protein [Bacillus subtilis]
MVHKRKVLRIFVIFACLIIMLFSNFGGFLGGGIAFATEDDKDKEKASEPEKSSYIETTDKNKADKIKALDSSVFKEENFSAMAQASIVEADGVTKIVSSLNDLTGSNFSGAIKDNSNDSGDISDLKKEFGYEPDEVMIPRIPLSLSPDSNEAASLNDIYLTGKGVNEEYKNFKKDLYVNFAGYSIKIPHEFVKDALVGVQPQFDDAYITQTYGSFLGFGNVTQDFKAGVYNQTTILNDFNYINQVDYFKFAKKNDMLGFATKLYVDSYGNITTGTAQILVPFYRNPLVGMNFKNDKKENAKIGLEVVKNDQGKNDDVKKALDELKTASNESTNQKGYILLDKRMKNMIKDASNAEITKVSAYVKSIEDTKKPAHKKMMQDSDFDSLKSLLATRRAAPRDGLPGYLDLMYSNYKAENKKQPTKNNELDSIDDVKLSKWSYTDVKGNDYDSFKEDLDDQNEKHFWNWQKEKTEYPDYPGLGYYIQRDDETKFKNLRDNNALPALSIANSDNSGGTLNIGEYLDKDKKGEANGNQKRWRESDSLYDVVKTHKLEAGSPEETKELAVSLYKDRVRLFNTAFIASEKAKVEDGKSTGVCYERIGCVNISDQVKEQLAASSEMDTEDIIKEILTNPGLYIKRIVHDITESFYTENFINFNMSNIFDTKGLESLGAFWDYALQAFPYILVLGTTVLVGIGAFLYVRGIRTLREEATKIGSFIIITLCIFLVYPRLMPILFNAPVQSIHQDTMYRNLTVESWIVDKAENSFNDLFRNKTVDRYIPRKFDYQVELTTTTPKTNGSIFSQTRNIETEAGKNQSITTENYNPNEMIKVKVTVEDLIDWSNARLGQGNAKKTDASFFDWLASQAGTDGNDGRYESRGESNNPKKPKRYPDEYAQLSKYSEYQYTKEWFKGVDAGEDSVFKEKALTASEIFLKIYSQLSGNKQNESPSHQLIKAFDETFAKGLSSSGSGGGGLEVGQGSKKITSTTSTFNSTQFNGFLQRIAASGSDASEREYDGLGEYSVKSLEKDIPALQDSDILTFRNIVPSLFNLTEDEANQPQVNRKLDEISSDIVYETSKEYLVHFYILDKIPEMTNYQKDNSDGKYSDKALTLLLFLNFMKEAGVHGYPTGLQLDAVSVDNFLRAYLIPLNMLQEQAQAAPASTTDSSSTEAVSNQELTLPSFISYNFSLVTLISFMLSLIYLVSFGMIKSLIFLILIPGLTIIGVLWHYFLRPLLSSLRLSDANGGSDRGTKGEDDGIWALQLLKGVSMLLGTFFVVNIVFHFIWHTTQVLSDLKVTYGGSPLFGAGKTVTNSIILVGVLYFLVNLILIPTLVMIKDAPLTVSGDVSLRQRLGRYANKITSDNFFARKIRNMQQRTQEFLSNRLNVGELKDKAQRSREKLRNSVINTLIGAAGIGTAAAGASKLSDKGKSALQTALNSGLVRFRLNRLERDRGLDDEEGKTLASRVNREANEVMKDGFKATDLWSMASNAETEKAYSILQQLGLENIQLVEDQNTGKKYIRMPRSIAESEDGRKLTNYVRSSVERDFIERTIRYGNKKGVWGDGRTFGNSGGLFVSNSNANAFRDFALRHNLNTQATPFKDGYLFKHMSDNDWQAFVEESKQNGIAISDRSNMDYLKLHHHIADRLVARGGYKIIGRDSAFSYVVAEDHNSYARLNKELSELKRDFSTQDPTYVPDNGQDLVESQFTSYDFEIDEDDPNRTNQTQRAEQRRQNRARRAEALRRRFGAEEG